MTRVTFPDGTHEDVEDELFEVAKSWDRQGRQRCPSIPKKARILFSVVALWGLWR